MSTNEKNDHNEDQLSRAYRKLRKAYAELKDSHLEMTFRLAMLAESRDSTTGTHLVRIADYSSIIARSMGLPESDVEILRQASPMHDVGKMMLPDSILKKKGPLTPQEAGIMKQHPRAGADIFKGSRSKMLKACRVIALTHHEKFNGTGYPGGLKGKNIPLYGRIVALADCFDALTSERPYKKAFDFEKALSIIIEEAGVHFDPSVVIAFIRCKEKAFHILKANRDLKKYLDEVEQNAEKGS